MCVCLCACWELGGPDWAGWLVAELRGRWGAPEPSCPGMRFTSLCQHQVLHASMPHSVCCCSKAMPGHNMAGLEIRAPIIER